MTYEEKIKKCANHLVATTGSFSAGEVLAELQKRGWASPADTVLDIHKLCLEIFGEPDGN